MERGIKGETDQETESEIDEFKNNIKVAWPDDIKIFQS